MAERNFGKRMYNSFSGADIRAVFGAKEIGELQAISYAIQREKAPIYTMGNANPRAFSRGKRGIAGTLVFIMFDQHALLHELGIYQSSAGDANTPAFLSNRQEYRPSPTDGVSNPEVVLGGDEDVSLVGAESGDVNFGVGYEPNGAWMVDQIPTFDVTVTAANEYGAAMVMRVIGVELLNEGYGVSVDDIVSEMQYKYVARTISPWRKVVKWELNDDQPVATVGPPRG